MGGIDLEQEWYKRAEQRFSLLLAQGVVPTIAQISATLGLSDPEFLRRIHRHLETVALRNASNGE
jgi:hypothetical protein